MSNLEPDKKAMCSKRAEFLFSLIAKIPNTLTSSPVLEFGVYGGYSLSVIKDALLQRGMNNSIYGFDSFQGLPHAETIFTLGQFACTKDECVSFLEQKYGAPLLDIVLIPGWYEDSLVPDLANQIEKASLIHVDCDLYTSTKTVLSFCKSLIRDGTIICFDEFNLGEDRAFTEFLNDSQDWEVQPLGGEFRQRGFQFVSK